MRGDAGGIALLAPPYSRMQRLAQNAPLGTILAVDLSTGHAVLREAIAAHDELPWCPLCLVAPPDWTLSDDMLQGLVEFPILAAIGCRAIPGSVSPANLLRSVRQRVPPTSRQLAQYIAQRMGVPGAFYWLQLCLATDPDRPGPGTPSNDTIRRHLREYGPLVPHEWRALAELITVVSDPGTHPNAAAGALARDHNRDPRTFRIRFHRLLGHPWRTVAERPGWEWLVEAAMRKWGYVRVADRYGESCGGEGEA